MDIRSPADATGRAQSPSPAASTSHYIEACGLRFHYLDYGTAGQPPMLCVHGGGVFAHWYDFVAGGFTPNYHVRALDLRGHGDSAWAEPPDYSYERYADDIAAIVDKLDLRDFVLIGHSMGGQVALTYAAHHSGRMARLIIVDATARASEARKTEVRSIGERPSKSYATREELVARYRLRPESPTTPPEIVRHLAQYSVRQSEDGTWRLKFDRRVYSKRTFIDGLENWRRIKVPALLVKGGLSQRLAPNVVAEIKASCPHLEFAEVAGSDHHIMLDKPEELSRVVNNFLASHS